MISDELKNKIRQESQYRCGYCLTPQEIVSMPLEIEHLHPIAEGGTDEAENLWLACRNRTAQSQKPHQLPQLTKKC